MIRNFEDLLVWQKARELTKIIYKTTEAYPSSEKTNLISQLRRATTSVCANIAEGFGRYHSQESIQFYRTARGSLAEIKSHLYISLDQGYITDKELKRLFIIIDEIGKMLSGLIIQTKNYRNSSKSRL